MGRKKNAVKKEHWRGLTLIEKIRLAVFGDYFFDESAHHSELMTAANNAKRDQKIANFHRAAFLLNKIHGAVKLERNSFESFKWPGVSNQEEYDLIKKFELKEAWEKFSEAFLKAAQNQDATIFKDMAHILENQYKPIQWDRYIFGMAIQYFQINKSPLPTPTQMVDLMNQAGFKFDHKKVKRLEDYFEVKLPRTTTNTR